jgi:hypothetical protein
VNILRIGRAVADRWRTAMKLDSRLRAAALALALVAPSLAWICLDQHVWPWDQAWYGEVSCDLWFSLAHSPIQWVHTMATALGDKPPAVVWIGQLFVPLGALFHSIEPALLLSIVATQAITLVLLALVFREVDPESRWTWIAGCALAGSAPLFAGLSHQFFAEPLQALCVAWAYLIATKAFKLARAEVLAQLLCCGLLGLLAKSTTPLYTIVPFLLAARGLLGAQPWFPARRGRFALWLVITGALLIAAARWYAINFQHVIGHAMLASVGSASLDYGWRDTFWNKAGLWEGLTLRSFLAPGAGWAVLACTGVGLWLGRRALLRGRRLLALGALTQLTIVIAVFSSVVTVETRYLFGILPTVALLLFLAATLAPSRPLALVWIAIALWQWGSTFAFAFGLFGDRSRDPWLLALDRDPGHARELERVIQSTAPQTDPPYYNITGIEFLWINANSAAFYAAKERLRTGRRAYYTSLGYAERDADAAWKRILDFHTRYFISMEPELQPKPPNFINLVNLGTLQQVERDPGFRRVQFESRYGVEIFERVAP